MAILTNDKTGASLRSAREQIGLTREELARQAKTSTSTIARMELNGHVPNGTTLVRIAAVLGLSADTILPTTPNVAASPSGLTSGVSFVSSDAA
ncbi:helix-turn-helix domain-containing protein [Subtercola endophyticus]|uniref:helix-turn-helix domain-containing protein n=1 Tax=Subtercola endophyticus TaxID=2895559 RepID=UPI0036F22FE9